MKRYKFKFNNRNNKYLLFEITNLSHLYIKNSQILNKAIRQKCSLVLSNKSLKFSKNFSFCFVSGRVRYTNNKLMLSRQHFGEYLGRGQLPGFYISNN